MTNLTNIGLLRMLKGYGILKADECAAICGVKLGMWYRWERGEYVSQKYLDLTANAIRPEDYIEIAGILESGINQDDYIHIRNILLYNKKVDNLNSRKDEKKYGKQNEPYNLRKASSVR